MRKLFAISVTLILSGIGYAQTNTPGKKNSNLAKRAGDHFMFQMSYDRWTGMPDSIDSRTKGLSRGFNAYVMYNQPFKGSPKLSVALGIGVSTSNIYFKKLRVNIISTSPVLPFTALDTVNYFKKYKLATTFLEIPLELRFTANPDKPGKSVKAAIGIKGGTLLNAHTKGKNLQNRGGETINGYTEKLNAKSYFNTTRLAATARIGYGYFTLFGAYNLTSVFKSSAAEDMKLLQVGLTISGL